MIDVKRLALLRDLHSLGTVAAVAQRNGISSSAVSQQLRALEAESPVKLLVRERKRLRFTPAGEFYLTKVNEVLNSLEDARNTLDALSDSITGPFRVASATGVIASVGGRLISEIHRRWNAVETELTEMQSYDVEAALLRYETDLALILEYGGGVEQDSFSSAVSIHPIQPEYFTMLVPERLADAARQRGLPALAGEPWCLNDAALACSRSILASARQSGFVPDVRYRNVSYANATRLVGLRLGVAVVPELSIQEVPRGVVAIRSDIPPRTISAVIRGGGESHPVVRSALGILAEMASERSSTSGYQI